MDDKEGKGVPFVKGSDTSTAAADSMVDHSANIELRILSFFMHEAGHQGATDDEIEQHLGLKHQTVSARRRQLEQRGMVVKMYNHGQRIKRPTRSGRQAGVYISRRIYNKAHDPVENAPVFYDHKTYELTQQLKHLRQAADKYVGDVDGSTGEIKNSCQALENMVNKLSCIMDDVKAKAREVWSEQHHKEKYPQ